MPNEEEELEQLKKIYDDLWVDARSMIKDMDWSLNVYLVSSIFIFSFGVATLFVAIAMAFFLQIMTLNWILFILIMVTTGCGACQIGFSIILLYWYWKLKGRYDRVIRQEAAAED